jgi:hypothetical protein
MRLSDIPREDVIDLLFLSNIDFLHDYHMHVVAGGQNSEAFLSIGMSLTASLNGIYRSAGKEHFQADFSEKRVRPSV